MILIYAFSNQWGTNISRRTLARLKQIIPPSNPLSFQIILYHPRSFFEKYIKNSNYTHIIGLGDNFGPHSKIKIETQARNLYGRSSIIPLAPISLELSLPQLDLVDTQKFSVSENMGNYNCNWIAFQTQYFLNHYSPSIRHLFLHLPKRQPAPQLAQDILVLLTANQMLK